MDAPDSDISKNPYSAPAATSSRDADTTTGSKGRLMFVSSLVTGAGVVAFIVGLPMLNVHGRHFELSLCLLGGGFIAFVIGLCLLLIAWVRRLVSRR